MYNSPRNRQFVTKKRMERRAADGRILSVTNTRTIHFDENPPPCHPHNRHIDRQVTRNQYIDREFVMNNRYIHHRSLPTIQNIDHQPKDETLRRTSVEYVDPAELYEGGSLYGDQWSRPSSVAKEAVVVRRERGYIREDNRETGYGTGRLRPSLPSSILPSILDRIDEIRSANQRPPLVADPSLAERAGKWAERLARSGEFRCEIGTKMNIWKGRNLTPSIVDSWFDEAEEYGTLNYLLMHWLRTVGVGHAFCENTQQNYVVVLYD